MRFKVWRSGSDDSTARYETFDIEPAPGMTVLEALFEIQDTIDDSLAFRYSCRGAICGSCAMTINREIRLACRTQVAGIAKAKPMNLTGLKALDREEQWDRTEEILVEPLPNLPVQKDLVVDMTRFFEAYRRIEPWLEAQERAGGLSRMASSDSARVERYANCILCAACFGACPVCERDPDYLGPAALCWSYRFITDRRADDKGRKLQLVSPKEGVPGCEFIYNCVKACPKAVAPASAIRALKDLLERKNPL